MADTSSRMLQLLNLLQLHRYWHGPDLAERLGVSARTLRRDIDRLRGLGYLIESVRGQEGGYQMASGASLPPLVFTDEEAVALAIGLRDVAHGSDPATAEASLHALAKLTATLPPSVRRRIELMAHVTEGPDAIRHQDQPPAHVLGTVAQACQDTVRLRFGYRAFGAAEDDESVERYVEPYRLVTRGRRWYLVAFDLDRDDWRTFRVDRISEPAPARNSFTPRPLPAQDLSRYVGNRIRELRPQHRVEIDVDVAADVARTRLGKWASVSPITTTSARVTLTTSDLDGALFAIFAIGAPFHVVTPELAEHVEQRSKLLSMRSHGERPTSSRTRA